jgi:dethiobiotin synthetase
MSIFVTGTDTNCGKTYISCTMLRALGAHGSRALGMKPVASGAESINGALVNDDVEALALASNVAVAPEIRNPYLFAAPASPHIAAAHAGAAIDLHTILTAYEACANAADFVVVEGVGGWQVPLNETLDVADLAIALQLPVLLVVAIKLGCINHALLTAAAIARTQLPFCGWVANLVEDDLFAREKVIQTLETRLSAPLLAVVDWHQPNALEQATPAFALRLQGAPARHV